MSSAAPSSDSPPHLLVERDEAVLVLTLNRPDKLNAISQEMFDSLAAAVALFRDDPALKVCLLRATGRYFCAGVDLKGGGRGPKPSDFATGSGVRTAHRIGVGGMSQIVDEMEMIEKPFVAAHHAVCLGGGLELSLACDFRLAAASAGYGFPEGRFGLLPATGGVSRLTRLVGAHWARYLIMANRRADAATALRMGLVHEVFADAEFEQRVTDFCRHLAGQNGEQMGTAKIAIEMARDVNVAQGRNVERLANSPLMLGPDYRAGMAGYVAGIGSGKK